MIAILIASVPRISISLGCAYKVADTGEECKRRGHQNLRISSVIQILILSFVVLFSCPPPPPSYWWFRITLLRIPCPRLILLECEYKLPDCHLFVDRLPTFRVLTFISVFVLWPCVGSNIIWEIAATITTTPWRCTCDKAKGTNSACWLELRGGEQR